jgi:hypothetical protein
LIVNARLAVAAILVAAAGCSSDGDEPSGDEPAAAARSRVERCTERILRRAKHATRPEVERYVRLTYCAPFAGEGWVYEDGTLRIDAHVHLENSGTCGTAKAGEPMRTVPCEQLDRGGPKILDCALLHHVRRGEVQRYVEEVAPGREVRCDDGTPLAKLGAPG